MKYLCPVLLLILLLLLCLAVPFTRTACPQCGSPIYLFLLRFCGCN